MKKNPMLVKNAMRSPEYAHLSEEKFGVLDCVPEQIEPKKDEILSLIFAPDPQTGVPRSDIGLLMSRQAEPEVQAYLERTLMSPLPESTGMPDADSALEMSREYGESIEQYSARLRELCKPKVKTSKTE